MSRFFTLKVRGIQNVYGIQRLIPQAVRRYRLYSFLRTFSTAVLALGFEWYTFSISYLGTWVPRRSIDTAGGVTDLRCQQSSNTTGHYNDRQR